MYLENRHTYQLLRNAKLGKIRIPGHLQPLASWIKKKYGTMPLWFTEDYIDSGGRPRLNVIFEWKKEEGLFYNVSNYGSFNQHKQKATAKKYEELSPDRKNVLVIYGNFEYSACNAANNKISKEERASIIQQYPEIWEIQPFTVYTSVFFFTGKQLKDAEQSGLQQKIREAYYKLLQQYDEFGYYSLENYSLYFDSKENFDTNYQSNWYYYYK